MDHTYFLVLINNSYGGVCESSYGGTCLPPCWLLANISHSQVTNGLYNITKYKLDAKNFLRHVCNIRG
jgi:hypothetical protein